MLNPTRRSPSPTPAASAPAEAPRRLVVELPLPHSECSPNWCGPWRQQRRRRTSYRQSCAQAIFAAAREAGIRTLQTPITVSYEFFLRRFNKTTEPNEWVYQTAGRYYPRDEDNARGSVKQVQDALIDAGLIPDDSHRLVRQGSCRLLSRKDEHQGRAALVLTIEEVPSDA